MKKPSELKTSKLLLTKTVLLGAVLVLIVILLGCATSDPQKANDQNSLMFSNFSLTQTYSKDKFTFYEYSDDIQKVDLQTTNGIKKTIAEQMISDKVAMFQSLFEKKRADYPGQYTQYIECPAEFKPLFESKNSSGELMSFFRTYANSNYVSGACSPDLVVHKSIYGFLFCEKSEKMFEFSYFTNLGNEAEERVNSFLGGVNCET